MGGRENSGSRNSGSTTKTATNWRDKNPEYQEKTLGGVYFIDAPPIQLPGGGEFVISSIDKYYYDHLPKYAKESVLQIDSSGESVSAWFKIEGGVLYMNRYGRNYGNLNWAVAQYKKRGGKFQNANGGMKGNIDDYVIDDFSE